MEEKENGGTLQGCLVFRIVRVTQSRQIPSPGSCGSGQQVGAHSREQASNSPGSYPSPDLALSEIPP